MKAGQAIVHVGYAGIDREAVTQLGGEFRQGNGAVLSAQDCSQMVV